MVADDVEQTLFEFSQIVAKHTGVIERPNAAAIPDEPLWKYAERKSEGRWKAYRWLKWVCEQITPMLAKGNARILVEAAPQHGKSRLISTWLPGWLLENNPALRVILASYADDLAVDHGSRVRDIVGGYGPAHWWKTDKDGGMLSTTFLGKASGFPSELLLLDDPIKNMAEALSPTYRDGLRQAYESTFLPRLQAGGNAICIMTRWTDDDFGEWLKKEKGFAAITLPAIAEDDDAMGREPGEPLCPERGFTLDFLLGPAPERNEGRKKEVGPIVWAGLYQQRPAPLEGNIYPRAGWKFYKELPEHMDRSGTSWDMTFKETVAGSFVCGKSWAQKGTDIFFTDEVRARANFVDSEIMIAAFAAKHQEAHVHLVEEKANGPAIISALQKKIMGLLAWPLAGEKHNGKVTHAVEASPFVAAGNIWLPDPSYHPEAVWVSEHIEECANFPAGKYNDRVDAMTQAILYCVRHPAGVIAYQGVPGSHRAFVGQDKILVAVDQNADARRETLYRKNNRRDRFGGM